MSDNNPWRTFLARRSHGIRSVHVPAIITEERRLEGWERAVDNIARELERLRAIEAAAGSTGAPVPTDRSAASKQPPGSKENPDPD